MARSRAVPERQRDFGEIEAAQAPAGSEAEAACPGGAAAKQRGWKIRQAFDACRVREKAPAGAFFRTP